MYQRKNGGIIAVAIVITILIATIGVLAYMLLNNDNNEPDKQNVTNSQEVGEEDEYKDKKKEIKIVKANGINYLSDYSAFDMKIDDFVDILEDVMEDPDQELKEKNGKYELELEHNILCEIEVDDDGYVKKLIYSGDIPVEETGELESAAGYMGSYFRRILNELDIEDMNIVQNGINIIADTGTSKDYDNYYIVEHFKMRLKEKDYHEYSTMTFELSPDKKETGGNKS